MTYLPGDRVYYVIAAKRGQPERLRPCTVAHVTPKRVIVHDDGYPGVRILSPRHLRPIPSETQS
jgi:hypothetical protein